MTKKNDCMYVLQYLSPVFTFYTKIILVILFGVLYTFIYIYLYILLFITAGRHVKSSRVSLSPSISRNTNSDKPSLIPPGSPRNVIPNTGHIQLQIDNKERKYSLNKPDAQNGILNDDMGNIK